MTNETSIPIRTAVYLDFDNLYSGLAETDPKLHSGFCKDPGTWLGRLENDFGAPAGGRRMLIARAYLNPCVHGRHRRHLTAAGFEVVDTPSLTVQGKSAADVRMVVDILDAVSSATRYEEFILLSGDADFTPILQRLRANDRRTTIVSSHPVAAAYRAVADTVIVGTSLVNLLSKGGAPAQEEHRLAPTDESDHRGEDPPNDTPSILRAISTVLEARGACEGQFAAEVHSECSHQGIPASLDAVQRVLALFDAADLPVSRLADPSVAGISRCFATIAPKQARALVDVAAGSGRCGDLAAESKAS